MVSLEIHFEFIIVFIVAKKCNLQILKTKWSPIDERSSATNANPSRA